MVTVYTGLAHSVFLAEAAGYPALDKFLKNMNRM